MTHILTTLSVSHVVQGIIVGGVLAFLTAQIIMNAVVKAMTTTVNGWSTTFKCGQPGNGILLRAACAKVLPAVNVVQEAAYWTTTVDSAGRRLSLRPGAERRWLHRHLSAAHGSRRARVQLAAGTGRLLQADAARVSARPCGPGRRVPRAASHESAMR